MPAFDVIVIGGGAAGLAAAETLAGAGRRVHLVEARRRLGGRIRTVHPALFPLPVELGAEFVHGTPPATLERLRLYRQPFYVTEGVDIHPTPAGLSRHPDFHASVGRVMERLDRLKGRDVSFTDFLATHAAGDEFAAARPRACAFVEGFDAADPALISARSLAEEWEGLGDVDDDPQHRLVHGYGALLRAMVQALPPARFSFSPGSRVTAVRWRRGHVTVTTTDSGGRETTLEARQAIVTLPLPFLQDEPDAPGGVQFEPDLPEETRAAARKLVMGPVVKVLLAFDTPFWANQKDVGGASLADMGFLFAPGAPFPTFWTHLPLRAPILTAWTAGPTAAALSGRRPRALIDTALDVLADTLRMDRARLAARLVGAKAADWGADPWARGAYSYVGVSGMRARAALARPIEKTLFLAGEATDTEGQASTVAGALASGERAAREALDAG
ncbi:MAG TPA: NAD(P)/FAD-dependent oxidoreductase [Rhodothermales bacterium]|nr:NAD(P)/FAD-dependent oxidoreductase [Rhodothermales bacterium]